MRINSIEINNYRQYKNNNIKFEKNGEHDLFYFIGANGVGKTTLLNAITWCLYAEEPHLGIKAKALPIVNSKTLLEMGIGDICCVNVEITMECDQGIVLFNRNHSYRKTEESIPFEISSNFEITTNFRGNNTQIYSKDDDTLEWLNKFVPERIREFFFFDGEQLDTYFLTDKGSKIETSIFEISQIDLLNSLNTRVSKTCDDLRKEAANISPNIKRINDLYEVELKNKNDLDNELSMCIQQISDAKIELDRCNEYLRGQADIADIEDNRRNINEKLDTENMNKHEVQRELRTFIKEYTVLLNLLPRVDKTLKIINDKESQGQLPPGIDKNLLLDMLSSGKCSIGNTNLDCICTSSIEELVEHLGITSEVSHLLVKIKGSLERHIEKALKYENEKNKILIKVKNINNVINKLEKDINDIDNTLSNYNNKEKIKRVHEERKHYEIARDNNIKKQGVLEEQLIKINNSCEDLKKKIDNEMDKNIKHNKVVDAQRLCEHVCKITKKMIEDLMNEVRADIASVMKELFFKLIWKKETFSDILLDDNYSISLIHADGYECLGTCSAAERALLALSFTLALHNVSGFDAPLIIDTPVSRISDKNRSNFADVLKDVSKEKQLILFLTPSEYSSELKEVFEKISASKIIIESIDERTVELRRE